MANPSGAKMKRWFCVLGMTFVSVVHGQENMLKWSSQCEEANDKCWLEKLVTFSSPNGPEEGGIAVAYDNLAKTPVFISVFVPKNVPVKSEVIVRFVDSVKNNEQWTLVPARDGFIGIPVTECEESGCVARVHAEISGNDGATVNLFDELKKRRFVWVMFKRGSKPESFIVPVSGINDALAILH